MSEFWIGLAILCIYFIMCASIALICRKTLKIPNELFRKILHFILLTSLFVFVFAFKTWWISAISCLLIIIIAYPILLFFEKNKSFSETTTERKKGEIRGSLVLVFLMFATVISICWGWLGNNILVLAVIYAWGYGDAFAALIGTKFGKHKIYKKKSLEGTLAMFIVSFIVVFAILFFGNLISWYGALITSLIIAISATIVELYTPNGLDTVTCPFTSLVVMLPLLLCFGAII